MAIIDANCTWSQRDIVLAFSVAGKSTSSSCTSPQQLGLREKTALQVLGISCTHYSRVQSASVDFAIKLLQQAVDHNEAEWLPVDSSSSTWAGKNGLLHKFRVCLAHPNDQHQHNFWCTAGWQQWSCISCDQGALCGCVLHMVRGYFLF